MSPIIVVIVLGGLFGGVVNFCLAKPDDVPTPNMWRSTVVGLAAAFLVPLFLNTISSTLIDLIKGGDTSKLLILLGFCLVASISSTAFIRTLSDRVLSEVKQAKKTALEAKAEASLVNEAIQPIVAKETESDQAASDVKAALEALTDEDRLLKALAEGRWALRSESGLASDTGLDRTEIGRLLLALLNRGMVERRSNERGTRWFVTDAGRAALRGL